MTVDTALERLETTDRIISETAPQPLLQVENLVIDMRSRGGLLRLVNGISFSIGRGERVALVGESGSGKSVTAQAIMRLNDSAQLGGRVLLDGEDVVAAPPARIARLRGRRMGMVFQDPMSSLDPMMTIGAQIAETLRVQGVPTAEARRRALSVLDELRVDRAAERLNAYPHEFSGGMRQRVVIAMALVGNPDLLIADEPTTALDVRVQERVLDLLYEISVGRGLAVLLITHDMGVVASFADRVMVMYSGRIVEENQVSDIFANPRHPYTRGLLEAIPRSDVTLPRLYSIPGAPPPPADRPSGCHFHPRCANAMDICRSVAPAETKQGTARLSCHLYGAAGA